MSALPNQCYISSARATLHSAEHEEELMFAVLNTHTANDCVHDYCFLIDSQFIHPGQAMTSDIIGWTCVIVS